jgi:hypothetical protein
MAGRRGVVPVAATPSGFPATMESPSSGGEIVTEVADIQSGPLWRMCGGLFQGPSAPPFIGLAASTTCTRPAGIRRRPSQSEMWRVILVYSRALTASRVKLMMKRTAEMLKISDVEQNIH